MSAAGSVLGCLLVRDRIAVATERWWQLLAGEAVLLARFISTLAACTSRDIPVYLPRTSPNVSALHLLQDLNGVHVLAPTKSCSGIQMPLFFLRHEASGTE